MRPSLDRHAAWFVVLALLLASGSAAAKTTPPDPRLGERLDGRAPPPGPRPARRVARAILWLPRMVVNAVLWPPIAAVRVAERDQLPAKLYWTFTSDDELRGARPIVRFESGFAIGLGVRLFDRKLFGRGSVTELRVAGSAPPVLLVDLHLRPADSWRIPIGIYARWDSRDDAVFGGVHGETNAELEAQGREVARYGYRRGLARLEYERPVGSSVSFLVDGALDTRSYVDGDTSRGPPISQEFCANPRGACLAVSPALVPGFHEGERLLVARVGADLDTRVYAGRGGGWVGHARAAISWGVMGDPSLFAGGELGAGRAIELGADRLLILRARGMLVGPLGDVPVSFEQLAMPGGPHGIRGIQTGRLRDQTALVGTAEYRWLLVPALDMTIFTDAGGAFGPWFEDVSLDRMIPSFGLGLHLVGGRGPHWRRRALGAVEVAWAPDYGTRLLFTVGNWGDWGDWPR